MNATRFRFVLVRFAGGALCLFALAAVVGCGGSDDRVATHAVSGKVVFPDGSPLDGGRIAFLSTEHGLSATGQIQSDGTFQLTTYEPGDGAVAGKHRVAVIAPMPKDVDPDEVEVEPLIDLRFQDLEASGLEFTVSADGPNEFTVPVESP